MIFRRIGRSRVFVLVHLTNSSKGVRAEEEGVIALEESEHFIGGPRLLNEKIEVSKKDCVMGLSVWILFAPAGVEMCL